MLVEAVRKKIAILDAASVGSEKESEGKEPGWIASLLLKIVDNIKASSQLPRADGTEQFHSQCLFAFASVFKVTVESLHVRYECPSPAGANFAVGLTIDRFTVRSTDGKWNPVDFVVRPKGQTVVFKRVNLEVRLKFCRVLLKRES
jgi:hypothetical protein